MISSSFCLFCLQPPVCQWWHLYWLWDHICLVADLTDWLTVSWPIMSHSDRGFIHVIPLLFCVSAPYCLLRKPTEQKPVVVLAQNLTLIWPNAAKSVTCNFESWMSISNTVSVKIRILDSGVFALVLCYYTYSTCVTKVNTTNLERCPPKLFKQKTWTLGKYWDYFSTHRHIFRVLVYYFFSTNKNCGNKKNNQSKASTFPLKIIYVSCGEIKDCGYRACASCWVELMYITRHGSWRFNYQVDLIWNQSPGSTNWYSSSIVPLTSDTGWRIFHFWVSW